MATAIERDTSTEDFIRLLYPDPELPGHLCVWSATDKRSYWFTIGDADAAGAKARQLAVEQHVYLGVALRDKGNVPDGKRGDKDSTIAIAGICTDLDIKGPTHSEPDLPPDLESIEFILKQIPLLPSVVVHSGGGVQAWWLFKEPWVFDDADDREAAEVLCKTFNSTLAYHAAQYDWKLDNVGDLARVLRLPGTLNHKTNPPLPVYVLAESEARYNPSDFDSYLIDPDSVQPQQQTVKVSVVGMIPRGVREKALFRIGRAMRGRDETKEAITAELTRVNADQCRADPLTKKEIGNLVKSLMTYSVNAKAESVSVPTEGEPKGRNGYMVANGRTLYSVVDKDDNKKKNITVVADLWARVIRDVKSDDGHRSFLIEGCTAESHRFQFSVEAATFADDRALKSALVAAAGSRSGVRKGQTGHLGPSIQAFTSESVPTIARLTRTGWRDSTFIIPGHEQPDTEIVLHAKLPYRLDPAACSVKGAHALAALLYSQPVQSSTICIAAILQGPLAHLCGWRNERYALMIAGQTGTLKTSWTQTAMCIYGPEFQYDERILKWGDGATKNAISRIAIGAADLPFFVDNYKPSTGGGSRDFVSLVHSLMEGGEKERLTAHSELRETRAFNCWPVFTGEDVPCDDAAALARVLLVRFNWNAGLINDQLMDAQAHASELCSVGAAWISWLETPEAQAITVLARAKFSDLRAKWAKRIIRHQKDTANALRIATNLTTNQLTYWVACQCPALRETLTPLHDEHFAGLDLVASEMADITTCAVEADKYLSAVQTLLMSRRCAIYDKASNLDFANRREIHIGYYDGDGGAYLFPETVMEQVLKLLGGKDALGNISPQKLYTQLDARGMLASRGAERTTKLIKINGKSSRVLHVTSEAIGELDQDSD